MSSCQKCWRDSASSDEHALRYRELLLERERDGRVCTAEEQAGPDAGQCPVCHRKTLHELTGEPMCECNDVRVTARNEEE